MIIKKGHDNLPTKVSVSASVGGGEAGLWIHQEGMPMAKETVSFLSLTELLLLRDELNEAIKKLVGIN